MIHMDAAPGTHPTIDLGCGTLCTLNYDSVISSALAVVVTIGVGFWLRAQLREGEPTRVQAIFELGYDQLRSLIKSNVSEDALFIIPLAMTLFMYILVANWLEILPLGLFPILHGANADLNQTLAMALIVSRVVAPAPKLSTLSWWADTTLGVDLGVADAGTDELYAAMDWLVSRQDAVEAKLATRHLAADANPSRMALFDLSSSWMTTG